MTELLLPSLFLASVLDNLNLLLPNSEIVSMPTTQLFTDFLSVIRVVLLCCSVILGFLHVCIHTFDSFISSLVESIVVVELNLSKHWGGVDGLRKVIAVLQR